MKNGLVILSVMIWVLAAFYLVILTTLSNTKESYFPTKNARQSAAQANGYFEKLKRRKIEDNQLQVQQRSISEDAHLLMQTGETSHALGRLKLPVLPRLSATKTLAPVEKK